MVEGSDMSEEGDEEPTVKLSVVIPCLNGAETLAVQLEALSRQEWSEPWEIVFSDNGSTDESLALVERYRSRLPRLKVVDASDEKGQPYALNRGVEAARGEALAFCDADDEVAPGWVEAIGEALKEHKFVAGRFDCMKLNPSWISVRIKGPQQEGLQDHYAIPYAGSGNMGIRRKVFKAVGGFDERLFRSLDVEFCWRVQQAGYELHFVPEALVYIRLRSGLLDVYRQARDHARMDVLLHRRYDLHNTNVEPPSSREIAGKMRKMMRQATKARSLGELHWWIWQLSWQAGNWRGRINVPSLKDTARAGLQSVLKTSTS